MEVVGLGLTGQHAPDPVCLKVVQQDGVLAQDLVSRPRMEVCLVTAPRRANPVPESLARSISVPSISIGRFGHPGVLPKSPNTAPKRAPKESQKSHKRVPKAPQEAPRRA